MSKLNRWLLIVLLLQIGALLAIRLIPGRGPVARPQKVFEGKLEASAVQRIQIKASDGKSVELAKQGGKWLLASGGGYPALENKVTELLGKLPGLSAGAAVSSKTAHHRALEVAADTFQREVRIEQPGKPPLHFYLGTSAGLKDVHLRLAGADDVYLVKDLSAWDVGTTPSDWVNTEYLKLERDSLVGLSIQNSEGEIELQKGDDGKWTLAGLTAGSKLKESEVESLLGSITSVALQEPVGQKLEPSHGLEKPVATVTVLSRPAGKEAGKPDQPKPEEAKKQTARPDQPTEPAVPVARRLFIGAKTGDAYFARAEGSPFVVKLSSWTAETFLKKKKADLEEQEKKEGDKKDEAADLPPGMPGGMPGMPPGMPDMHGHDEP